MKTTIQHIGLLERIDQLIRMQATGTPEELACKLDISRTTLYRIIALMKELNAPVEYDIAIRSFVYAEEVGFRFGFYKRFREAAGR